jgi:hypothetical protein
MVGLAGHVCHKQDYELLVHGCHAGNLASSWHHPCKLTSLSIILSLLYQTLPKSSVQCLHKDTRICPLLHFFSYKGVTPSLLGVCFDAFVHCLLSTYFDIQLVFNVVSLKLCCQVESSTGEGKLTSFLFTYTSHSIVQYILGCACFNLSDSLVLV